ncbi:hypothetical protein ACQKEN_10180 [Pseudomonas sp. NPDC078416]|uniref:hypothetical protein n=1 Tax=Pseudomonas sp. NPDC078416 TaxID=3390637 RepID=UPI003CFF5AAD
MAVDITQKLKKLVISAKEKGHFVVEATAARLLDDPMSLDYQINVVGALHEVGTLKNVISPLWQALRTDQEKWAHRCCSRLLANDHDGWALAALLGLPSNTAVTAAKSLGWQVVSFRQAGRWDKAPLHIASMSLPSKPGIERMLVPLLELGWDSVSSELLDCVRARAVLLAEQTTHEGSLIGKGTMSNFCRASLPHGMWRSVSLPFEITEEDILPSHKFVGQ